MSNHRQALSLPAREWDEDHFARDNCRTWSGVTAVTQDSWTWQEDFSSPSNVVPFCAADDKVQHLKTRPNVLSHMDWRHQNFMSGIIISNAPLQTVELCAGEGQSEW